MTHRLPGRTEHRQGLSGSMNTIGTQLKFTPEFMTKYTKSAKGYTIHFQQAFIHGYNFIAAAVHSGKDVEHPDRAVWTVHSRNYY